MELQEALNNLPEGLEATYERILWAIDERNAEGEAARRTLVWLMVALEPLRLAQVVDGLLVDPEQQKMTRQTSLLRIALLNALSSLVSYYEETDLLALSHFSVNVCSETSSYVRYSYRLSRRNTWPAVLYYRRIVSYLMRLTPK